MAANAYESSSTPGNNAEIALVKYESLTQTTGKATQVRWDKFCEKMSVAQICESKQEVRLWSPCKLHTNIRKNANVESITALVLDIDHGTDLYSFEDLLDLLSRYAGFIHTTHSHTLEKPRYRVALEITQPIPALLYRMKREAFLQSNPVLEKLADPACKDLSRAYYRFSHSTTKNSSIARFERLNGSPIDPEDLIYHEVKQLEESVKKPKINSGDFFDLPLPEYLKSDEIDFTVSEILIGQFHEIEENVDKVTESLSYISADCTYPEWRDIIFALKSSKWNCAEQLALEWSKTAPNKWDFAAFQNLWSHAKPDGAITLGTLFYRAKAGWFNDISHHSEIDTGLSDNQAKEKSRLFDLDDGKVHLSPAPPAARDYVFADCVVAGTLNLFSGLGGTAKTTALMQIAAHGALGQPLGDINISEFSTILFLGEETAEERDRRLGAICKDYSKDEQMKIIRRIRCFPAAGKDLRLTAMFQNNLLQTGLASEVIQLAEAFNQETDVPVKMIVFDHARLVMSGDANDAGAVTQLTRVLTDIAIKTQSAVILLGHSPKTSINKETSSDASEIFGSTAFVDNARAAFVLHTMREKEAKTYGKDASERTHYVCLTPVKSNYGAANRSWWFKKVVVDGWQTIKLEPTNVYDVNLFQDHNALSKRILDLVRNAPAQLSERKIRDFAGLKGQLKASERDVISSLSRLVEEGYLKKRKPSDGEKKQYKLSSNIKEILVLAEDTAV